MHKHRCLAVAVLAIAALGVTCVSCSKKSTVSAPVAVTSGNKSYIPVHQWVDGGKHKLSGIIDSDGRMVLELSDRDIEEVFVSGAGAVYLIEVVGKQKGVSTIDGKQLIKPLYDDIEIHTSQSIDANGGPFVIAQGRSAKTERPFTEIFSLPTGKKVNQIELIAAQIGLESDIFRVMPERISDESGNMTLNREGLMGYMSLGGEMIISAQFDQAYSFFNGVARVKLTPQHAKALCGPGGAPPVLQNENVWASCRDLMADSHFDFDDDYEDAVASDGAVYINRTGQVISRIDYEDGTDFGTGRAIVKRNDMSTLLDENGNEVSPFFDAIFSFTDGIAPVRMLAERFQETVALCNAGGQPKTQNENILATCKTLFAQHKNVLEACKPENSQEERDEDACIDALIEADLGAMAYINMQGQIVSRFDYDVAGRHTEGRGRIARNELFGYIDAAGREVIAPGFEDASKFYGGLAGVVLPDSSGWKLIDKKGLVLSDCWMESFNDDKLFLFVDRDGDVSYARECEPFESGRGWVLGTPKGILTGPAGTWKNDQMRVFLVDNQGRVVLPYAIAFNDDLALASRQPRLSSHDMFTFGIPDCEESDTCSAEYRDGWINTAGKIIWPPGWNDPCANTGGVIVWPEGSCK
ncbi:MAG: WG repeat-containing protein [Proteobacteria bacterium]|nr:WG repeat-containing protein [Pseudomonadota bacterium]